MHHYQDNVITGRQIPFSDSGKIFFHWGIHSYINVIVSKATMLIFDRPRTPSTLHNFVTITQWDLHLSNCLSFRYKSHWVIGTKLCDVEGILGLSNISIVALETNLKSAIRLLVSLLRSYWKFVGKCPQWEKCL